MPRPPLRRCTGTRLEWDEGRATFCREVRVRWTPTRVTHVQPAAETSAARLKHRSSADLV